MGNKIDLVFQNMFNNSLRIGKLKKFLDAGHPEDLYLDKYKEIVKINKHVLQELSALEEIILQMRTWAHLSKNDIKITPTKDYIYVRANFYRSNKIAKEIRVTVGRVDDWFSNTPVNPQVLYDNDEFMALAHFKLTDAMAEIIHKNNDAYSTKFKQIKTI